MLRKASAAGLLQAIWAALGAFVSICLYLVSERAQRCADSRNPFYLTFCGRLACGGWGRRYWSCNKLASRKLLRLHMCSADGPCLHSLPRLAGPLASLRVLFS